MFSFQKPGQTMPYSQPIQTDGVGKRVMILYGLHTLLNNGSYLVGFYLLPQGFMRASPQVAVGGAVGEAASFWFQLVLTLLFNLALMSGLAVVFRYS